jgi:hypothetical protein
LLKKTQESRKNNKVEKKKKKKRRRTVKLHRGGQFFLAEKGNTYIRLHKLVGYNIKEWFYFKDRRENWLSFCNWCLIVFFFKFKFF